MTRPRRRGAAPVEADAAPPVAGPAAFGAAPAAFGAALQAHAPLLLAAARAIVLDEREAEDLVQTTFELALRNRGQLRDPSALRGWLLAIQAREAFRVGRRLRRLLRLDAVVTEIAVDRPTDASRLVVRDALRSLPPRIRAAVVLHDMADLSVSEVAAALGTSENTVKTQLRVGRARLREVLADD